MTGPIKIVVSGSFLTSADDEWSRLAKSGFALKTLSTTSEEEIIAGAKDAHGLIVKGAILTRRTFQELPSLQAVVYCSVGYDRVDVDAANEFGVVVANSPTFCNEEVSDHASMLILTCARQLASQLSALRQDGWDTPNARKASERISRFRGQTLGFVGFGRIGQATAENLSGFGLRYLAYDPYIEPDIAKSLSAELVSMEDLCRESDLISVHAPLMTSTRHLLGVEQFKLMKQSAHIINTSRGPVIDEAALIVALQSGWIASAALDVMEQEPPRPDNPLLSMENVLLTCHSAGQAKEARRDNRRHAVSEIIRVFEDRHWPTALVNPEVKERARLRSVISAE